MPDPLRVAFQLGWSACLTLLPDFEVTWLALSKTKFAGGWQITGPVLMLSTECLQHSPG